MDEITSQHRCCGGSITCCIIRPSSNLHSHCEHQNRQRGEAFQTTEVKGVDMKPVYYKALLPVQS